MPISSAYNTIPQSYNMIYPNPATKGLVLSNQEFSNGQFQISIVDMFGAQIYESKLTSVTTVVNLDQYQRGLYILHLTAENYHHAFKIILE